MSSQVTPLFICHANCCRSVLASYLYRQHCAGAPVLSAGLEPGEQTSDRALAMLARWGIDAHGHQPTQVNRGLCDEANALFVMAPPYVRRLLLEYGADLADKTYLFADPFTRPRSLGSRRHTVADPSFDERPIGELVSEYGWMRERVSQIRDALLGRGQRPIPAASYLELLESVDPRVIEPAPHVIVHSHEKGCKKPDPRVFEIGCRRLDVQVFGGAGHAQPLVSSER